MSPLIKVCGMTEAENIRNVELLAIIKYTLVIDKRHLLIMNVSAD